MKRALRNLVSAYIETSSSLFPRLATHLGITIAISNIEWVCADFPQKGITGDGISYAKHGYGVAMNDGEKYIDLDLGDNGEIDGFDAWRLFMFADENGISTGYKSHCEIESELESAVSKGHLFRSGSLLYVRRK